MEECFLWCTSDTDCQDDEMCDQGECIRVLKPGKCSKLSRSEPNGLQGAPEVSGNLTSITVECKPGYKYNNGNTSATFNCLSDYWKPADESKITNSFDIPICCKCPLGRECKNHCPRQGFLCAYFSYFERLSVSLKCFL